MLRFYLTLFIIYKHITILMTKQVLKKRLKQNNTFVLIIPTIRITGTKRTGHIGAVRVF